MDGRDIVRLYGDNYAVRDVANAWQAAGSPPINSAGRLYGEQKKAWNNSPAMGGNGAPADNPDRPDVFPLAHVRFAALDIDATADRVRRLTAAGLWRPYSYEPWHWQPRDIYFYPIVHSIPSTAGSVSTPLPVAPPVDYALLRRMKEPTMYVRGTSQPQAVYNLYTDAQGRGHLRSCPVGEAAAALAGGLAITCDDQTLVLIAQEARYYEGADSSARDAIWNDTLVQRSTGPVSAIQELADIRSEQIRLQREAEGPKA